MQAMVKIIKVEEVVATGHLMIMVKYAKNTSNLACLTSYQTSLLSDGEDSSPNLPIQPEPDLVIQGLI